LAGWAPDQLPVTDRLLTLLRQLHGQTGDTVMLGSPHRHYSRCIFVLNGTAPDSHESMIGDLCPLSTSAAGHVLLTLKTEAEVRGIIRRANAEEEDASRRVSPAALLERIDRCKAQGFAYTDDRKDEDETAMIAMLLPPHEDGTPLCLAIAGPIRRIRPNHAKLVRQLRDVVEQLVAGPIRPEPRVAVGDVRREGGYPRPDLHLVRQPFAALAETQQAK
jgi:DNA-binding IclR family transcriptional regulator